jgi:hypothetical protein
MEQQAREMFWLGTESEGKKIRRKDFSQQERKTAALYTLNITQPVLVGILRLISSKIRGFSTVNDKSQKQNKSKKQGKTVENHHRLFTSLFSETEGKLVRKSLS